MEEQQAGAGGTEISAEVSPAMILAETAAKLNFAAHQSAFAFLRDLRVTNNDASTPLNDVLITLSASPAFLKPKSWHLDRIAPAGTIAVRNWDVELDGGFLLDLTELICGTVTVLAEQGGRVLAQETKTVELLAYNEWGGGGYMPELLAAFSIAERSGDRWYSARRERNPSQGWQARRDRRLQVRQPAESSGRSLPRSTRPSATSASPMPCRRPASNATDRRSGCLARSWRDVSRRAWIPRCCSLQPWSRPV